MINPFKLLKTILKSNKPIDLLNELYNIELAARNLVKKTGIKIFPEKSPRATNSNGKIAGSFLSMPAKDPRGNTRNGPSPTGRLPTKGELGRRTASSHGKIAGSYLSNPATQAPVSSDWGGWGNNSPSPVEGLNKTPQPQPEEAPTKEEEGNSALDTLQWGLTLASFVPVIGTPAALLDAGISAMRGNYGEALLSVASAVPVAGSLAAAGKVATKGSKAVSKISKVQKTVGKATETVNPRLAAELGEAGTDGSKAVKYISEGPSKAGEFKINNWENYPENLPKPKGPFKLFEGSEYEAARDAANKANRAIHDADPSLKGKQIHEIQPVKFGGSPTDTSNKIALTPPEHAKATTWWRRLQRDLEKDK